MDNGYGDLVVLLVGAMSQRTLYSPEHPRVRSAAMEFASTLAVRLRADEKKAFFLGVVQDRLVHDGHFLFGSTMLGRRLIEFTSKLHCGGLLFRKDATFQDVLALLELFARTSDPLPSLAVAREQLAQLTRAIQLSPPHGDPTWFGHFLYERDATEERQQLEAEIVEVCRPLFDTVDAAHVAGGAGGAIDVNQTRATAEKLIRDSGGRFHDVLRLVQYSTYDAYTVGHSVRVAMLAVHVGAFVGLPAPELIELGTAGLLHDVGKSQIPSAILFKRGSLDEEERRVISHHPRLGAEILVAQRECAAASVGAAYGHHMRNDQRGYPTVWEGYPLGRTTKLIQVCDVYEALTAERPYKRSYTPRRALEMMVADDGQFDPTALSAFVRAMGIYPPGSRVRLSSGETALVLRAGEDLDRPVVQVTHAASGEERPPDQREYRDLGEPACSSLSVRALLRDAPAEAHAECGGDSHGDCC
jgi:HD-GYP domain-containing protein (c-di-GMP phosphodiesterase class II)